MSIDVINPATGQLLNRYTEMSQTEVGDIITNMETVRQTWLQTTFSKRRELMHNAAQVIRDNLMEYATIITQEMGKPITQAKAEMEKCALLCEYYADHAEKHLAPVHIETEKRKSYKCFEPLGIILSLIHI